jgi:hypothetical protein
MYMYIGINNALRASPCSNSQGGYVLIACRKLCFKTL